MADLKVGLPEIDNFEKYLTPGRGDLRPINMVIMVLLPHPLLSKAMSLLEQNFHSFLRQGEQAGIPIPQLCRIKGYFTNRTF